MPVPADLAVVVLNWRNSPDTIECLESLAKSTKALDVIVVDNDSGDGSADAIEASGLARWVIRHSHNAGYAGGNNVGLTAALDAGYETIAVLNNDTVVDVDAFAKLMAALSMEEAPAAISPRIRYFDHPDQVWFAGGVIDHGLPRHLQAGELASAGGAVGSETLTGCCIVARSGVWRKIGLFDEGYFLIFEDSDWSARAQAAGVRLVIANDSIVRHKVSRSFAGGPMALISTYFYVRNGLRYHAHYQLRHLPRFAMEWVLKPILRPKGAPRGRALFTCLATVHWLVGFTGNAPARAWRLAHRVGCDMTT